MRPDHATTRALVALRKLGWKSGPRALAAVMGNDKAEAERIIADLAARGLVTPPGEGGITAVTEAGKAALS